MRRRLLLILLAGVLGLGGCAVSSPERDDARPTPGTSAPADPVATDDPARSTAADRAYQRMTPAERVGQLFMFGLTTTGPSEEMYAEMAAHGIGNAFLRGPSELGLDSVRAVTDRIAATTTVAGVRPFVSADQEGGNAQALEGEGFSDMPTALSQGSLGRVELRRAARGWARELRAAGVNLNLAPVADVVPSEVGVDNDPIGFFRREFGATPEAASPAVGAFVRGSQVEGVATSVKHFPGLGRATGNTDSDPTATDPTVRDDALLAPFAKGVRADAAFVMVSSAHYPAIDPDNRACFSPTVIEEMLRGDLGYDGLVISDSFGSASVAGTPPGRRAVRFLQAGGTMVLDTNYLDAAPMTRAVLARAEADPDFADLVEANVRRVLAVKDDFGLIG